MRRFKRQTVKFLIRISIKELDNKRRKSALTVLSEIVIDGNDSLCDEALELALESGRTDADSIRQCYYLIAKPEHHPQPLILTANPPVSGFAPNLDIYDGLYSKGGDVN